MNILLITCAAFGLLTSHVVNAQSSAWGQCGGIGWTGATTCVSGYTCTYSSAYYSQCIPGTAGTTTAATTTQATTTVGGGTTATTTSSGASATGSQIRAVTSPVFHFYLQNKGGVPVLGPEASSGYFTLGSTIKLNGATPLYLNLNTSGTASYQALTFGTTATTTDWGLEGDTIITTSPRQLNFIACSTSDSTIYSVYLQNGNDTPAGASCTLQTLHLPCLC